ncbi:acyltransferase [Halorussus salinus]|uniref:acyltransferase n=1 Tax=Halorussus salinus TaxID=1364935 RepID=UPI00138EE638|nr:acyltransferase [Halorussus salinus]
MDEAELKASHEYVYDGARIVNPENLTLGEEVEIDDFVFLNCGRRTELGDRSCLHAGTRVVGGGELVVGSDVAVTYNCVLVTRYSKATSHMSTRVPSEERDDVMAPIAVGDEAFVGSNAVVMPGVTIGEGAVVTALSYVDEDVPPWTIRYPNGELRERDEFEPYSAGR